MVKYSQQFQKISHENDIVFDDSPLDASEGQRLLHARNVNEIESNDEHWLWAHVGRIKRSIGSVIGDTSKYPNKRIKRNTGWSWPWDTIENSDTTESTTPESPKENEEPTQNDISVEDDITEPDDLESDTEGSGTNKNDKSGDVTSPYCELLNCFQINWEWLNKFSSISIVSVRLKFKLNEVWTPDYQNENSEIFKEKCHKLAKQIEELYARQKTVLPSSIEARVTEIR